MSTDWSIVCDRCNLSAHLGQRMGDVSSFGYGLRDTIGKEDAAAFITEHIDHQAFLRVMPAANVPDSVTEIWLTRDDDPKHVLLVSNEPD